MVKNKEIIKNIFFLIFKICVFTIFKLIEPLGVKMLYFFTKRKNEKDKILSIHKYKRIKKSIRYKLWVWNNMRWICELCNLNFSPYNKFYKNKEILRY